MLDASARNCTSNLPVGLKVLYSDMSTCVRRGIVRLLLPEFYKTVRFGKSGRRCSKAITQRKTLLSAESVRLMSERNVTLFVEEKASPPIESRTRYGLTPECFSAKSLRHSTFQSLDL